MHSYTTYETHILSSSPTGKGKIVQLQPATNKLVELALQDEANYEVPPTLYLLKKGYYDLNGQSRFSGKRMDIETMISELGIENGRVVKNASGVVYLTRSIYNKLVDALATNIKPAFDKN